MDDSKINKSEISYHNSVGKVDVHIKTGRMIYEYPLFALGGGNYQIMVSLLYNSHYPISTTPLEIHTFRFPVCTSRSSRRHE